MVEPKEECNPSDKKPGDKERENADIYGDVFKKESQKTKNNFRGDKGYFKDKIKKEHVNLILDRAQKLEDDKKSLQNFSRRVRIWLRIIAFVAVLIMLLGELVLIAKFTYWQATGLHSFRLEPWTFNGFVAATAFQIYKSFQVIIKYLFPDNNQNNNQAKNGI